jgi:hypothetical protein
MKHQNLNIDHTTHRFDLKINSNQSAQEKAFNLYGILIIPALLGGVLMYNIFQLRDEYWFIAYALLMICLMNLYFFNQRKMKKNDILKLVITGNYIQCLDNDKIYFQGNLEDLQSEVILCGKSLQPAIKVHHPDAYGLVIGLKHKSSEFQITQQHELCQPDYWLRHSTQSERFMALILKRDVEVSEAL